jgi:hypothetical protein
MKPIRAAAVHRGLADWQQEIVARGRYPHADAEVVETIKRTATVFRPANICALLLPDHVNVCVRRRDRPGPEGIITAGHDNQTARTVGIRKGETLNAPALSAMFKQIIANNRAGGWRKLKGVVSDPAAGPSRNDNRLA